MHLKLKEKIIKFKYFINNLTCIPTKPYTVFLSGTFSRDTMSVLWGIFNIFLKIKYSMEPLIQNPVNRKTNKLGWYLSSTNCRIFSKKVLSDLPSLTFSWRLGFFLQWFNFPISNYFFSSFFKFSIALHDVCF